MVKITLQILLGLAAVLTIALDYIFTNKKTKKFNYTLKALIFTTIIIAISSIYLTVSEDNKQQKQEEKLNLEIALLKDSLTNLSQKIESSNSRILNTMIGEKSYCYGFIEVNEDSSKYLISLRQIGEYPLRELSVKFHNVYESVETKDNLLREIYVGSLLPGEYKPIGEVPLYQTKRRGFHLSLYFEALNGKWVQAFEEDGNPYNGMLDTTYFRINNISAETIPITENPFDYQLN